MTDRKKAPTISDAEEARIQEMIAADPDDWEADEFSKPLTAEQALPAGFHAEVKRRARGPGRKPSKEIVSLRLDPDVVAAFKADGPGWQSRVNDALRKAKKLPATLKARA